jgi:O-antigen ligase
VGFSAAKDQTGTFFALTTPILLSFHPLLGIISLIGCIVSKSSFAFISSIISGLFYIYFRSKKIFLVSLVVLSVFGLIFFGKYEKVRIADFKTRFSVWSYALTSVAKGNITLGNAEKTITVKCNPAFGFGFGRFLSLFPYVPQRPHFNYSNEKFTHAHNDYVEFIFELGYIGLILLILLIGSIIYSFIKSKKDIELVLYFSVLIAYMLNAFGNFLSQISVSGAILIVYLGMYLGKRRELNGKFATVVSGS